MTIQAQTEMYASVVHEYPGIVKDRWSWGRFLSAMKVYFYIDPSSTLYGLCAKGRSPMSEQNQAVIRRIIDEVWNRRAFDVADEGSRLRPSLTRLGWPCPKPGQAQCWHMES